MDYGRTVGVGPFDRTSNRLLQNSASTNLSSVARSSRALRIGLLQLHFAPMTTLTTPQSYTVGLIGNSATSVDANRSGIARRDGHCRALAAPPSSCIFQF